MVIADEPQRWGMTDDQFAQAAAERKASAALILAVLGVILVPILCSALAVVFGIQASRALTSFPAANGGGRALAAIYVGAAGLILAAVGIVLRSQGVI
jgi:hypothetical protein